MAITTLDGLLTAYQPPRMFHKGSLSFTGTRWGSYWGTAGIPGAGSFDTTLAGVVLSSTSAKVNGQLPFNDAASGSIYLAKFQMKHSSQMSYYLCDRIWHNGGITITSTSAQTVNSPTWPARDQNGSTNGVGVYIGLEVSQTTGVNTPTITISYTNSSNTSGRTGTLITTPSGATSAQTFGVFSLQSGDVGVRSVQSVTLSQSWSSGTINLVAFRPLSVIEGFGYGAPNVSDPLSCGFPILYNGSVPYFITMYAAQTWVSIGELTWAQG